MSGADDPKPPLGTPARTAMPIARVGAGQSHCDTLSMPEPRYVLVDGPLDPAITLTLTETIPLAGPVKPNEKTPVETKTDTRRAVFPSADAHPPKGVPDEPRVYYLDFWQTVDSARMALVAQRGPSKLPIFEDVGGDELCLDQAAAPGQAKFRVGATLVYEIPRPRPTTDKLLVGDPIDYQLLDVEEVDLG